MNNSTQQRSLQPQQLQAALRLDHDINLWSKPITMQRTLSVTSAENLAFDIDNVEIMEDIAFEETLEKIETQSFTETNTIDLDLPSNIEANIAPLEEPHYILRSSAKNIKLPEEIVEESKSEIELLINLKDIGFDSEDLQGATLDDAFETIEGKN